MHRERTPNGCSSLLASTYNCSLAASPLCDRFPKGGLLLLSLLHIGGNGRKRHRCAENCS
ncbi:unnamed protein product [Ectocarpus fasciculatus]